MCYGDGFEDSEVGRGFRDVRCGVDVVQQRDGVGEQAPDVEEVEERVVGEGGDSVVQLDGCVADGCHGCYYCRAVCQSPCNEQRDGEERDVHFDVGLSRVESAWDEEGGGFL